MHHEIDPYPMPKGISSLYIHEPWLIDPSLQPQTLDELDKLREPDDAPDNIRVYFPMDLNHDSIMRRLDHVIGHYGESTNKNEFDFSSDVSQIIAQLEIYDRVHFLRAFPTDGRKHSYEGIALMKDMIQALADIPDGGSETFPFDTIDELKKEYLQEQD